MAIATRANPDRQSDRSTLRTSNLSTILPNIGLQLTAYSVRSYVAPASGSS